MKKFFTTITILAMFLVVGCVDLDDLWGEIDSLKKQGEEQSAELAERKAKIAEYKAWLEGMKQVTSDANSEVSSIKGLVDAMTKKVYIVSYNELEDKSGYELVLSDGTKMVLKHGPAGADGKDGKDGAEGKAGNDGIAPNIGVKKHSDGLLYWSVNGEFLIDSDGKMVPAQGKDGADGKDGKDGADGAPGTDGKDGKDGADGATGATGASGKDGFTPLLRINSNLYWEMSLDGGKTWQLVKDTNNKPVYSRGPKGTPGADAVAGSVGPQGPTGSEGPEGPKGETGDPGQDGDPNLTITEANGVVTIVYKGNVFIIPKLPLMSHSMTFTTTKNVGESLRLKLDAAEADRTDIWIDLNNNGTKDSGEDEITFDDFVYFNLGAQTVTIYGKVTTFNCSNQNITELDVTKNPVLQALNCSHNSLSTLDVSKNTGLMKLYSHMNKIKKAAMDNLVNSIVNRTGNTPGIYYLYYGSLDENEFEASHASTLADKNWQKGSLG